MGTRGVLLDTSALFAAADEDAARHREVAATLEATERPLIVPMLVVAETAYLISTRLGTAAEARFVGAIASGDLVAEPVRPGDWLRIVELVVRYADFPLGTVDASVVATAERVGITRIATLDRRHFGVVRPAHADAFELLP